MFFMPSQIREINKKPYFPEENSFFLGKSAWSFSVWARRPEKETRLHDREVIFLVRIPWSSLSQQIYNPLFLRLG
jgi:hypothetical protein